MAGLGEAQAGQHNAGTLCEYEGWWGVSLFG
jgi:hypothetical protein